LFHGEGIEVVIGCGLMPTIAYQPNDGAVIAPKPPLFAALSSGFIVPFSIGQSLVVKMLAYICRCKQMDMDTK
jgi:hypothetical protein